MHNVEFLENFSLLDSAVGCTPWSLTPRSFLKFEIETELENNLACLSGAQMGLNHEKNWRSKISWHTPFKEICVVASEFFLA